MADDDDPILPRQPVPPPLTPGKPLPRIWKVEPEPEPEEPPARDRRSRRAREKEEKEEKERAEAEARAKARPKAKAKPKAAPGTPSKGEKKGVLLEETPGLDTYQTRQRVRMLIGGGIAAGLLVGIVVLLQMFRGPSEEFENLPDEGGLPPGHAAAAPGVPAIAGEQEAKNLLDTARQLAKNQKTSEAVTLLKRVTTSYPRTAAAAKAKEALGRPAENLPLFVEEPTVLATPKPSAATRQPGAPIGEVVQVVEATAPRIASGDAQLHLPANKAEPARPGGVPAAPTSAVAARPLPAGFQANPEAGVHSSGWPAQITSDRDGAPMCLVPAGTFLQGRDDGPNEEAPEHRVKLSAFYVDQHEVTVRQWGLYVKESGRRALPPRSTAKTATTKAPDAGDELPAVNLTATEAKAYCDWAGKRLPTEAQWEAAARATDGRLYPWGSALPIWSRPRVSRQIDPVMSYELDQSPYAVYDLAGNAWEWTRDWFDSRYYPGLKGQVAENPTGPQSSRSRPPQLVVKGGSKGWFVTAREGLKVETRLPYVGFRGVLAVEGAGASESGVAPAQGTPNSVTPPPNQNGVVPF